MRSSIQNSALTNNPARAYPESVYRILPLLALLLAACTPQAQDPKFAADLADFDLEYQVAQRDRQSARSYPNFNAPDMRQRTISDDLDRWVFPAATQEAIRLLRELAVQTGDTTPLGEARRLVRADRNRFRQINNYWLNFPAPFWRRNWQQFSIANEMPEMPPPEALLDAERLLVAQLEAGYFAKANTDGAPRLIAALRASQKEASSVIAKRRLSANLRFQPRKTSCGAALPPDRSQHRPKFMGGIEVESFYPRDAMTRGEEGLVILRLRISETGCASAGAILVHSGFAALDAAALEWMETAQYSPGFENGRAVAGQVSVKVLFKIES